LLIRKASRLKAVRSRARLTRSETEQDQPDAHCAEPLHGVDPAVDDRAFARAGRFHDHQKWGSGGPSRAGE
jgi:hypothetical protein